MASPPGFEDLASPWRERAEDVVRAALRRAVDRAAEFQFASFRIGTRAVPRMPGVDEPTAELQQLLRAVIRVELRRRLEEAWPARRFDPDRPDVILDVRPWETGAGAWFLPQQAFVAGRYRKLSRELSQTEFHCRRCRGRGARRGVTCAACSGSRRVVAEAVEDFVRPPIEQALRARGSVFHGSGREDVDVLMLGAGRPFVVTVQEPALRSLEPEAVAGAVRELSGGRVEVSALRVVDRDEKRRVTTEHGLKQYRVVVTTAGGGTLPNDAAERVVQLAETTLAQRNPQRVRRRADIVRRRMVHEVRVQDAGAERLVLHVTTDPGLYVKEMVSGDDGRTAPSVTELLGMPCVCVELDVIGVN